MNPRCKHCARLIIWKGYDNLAPATWWHLDTGEVLCYPDAWPGLYTGAICGLGIYRARPEVIVEDWSLQKLST